jgi:hypothetical protein
MLQAARTWLYGRAARETLRPQRSGSNLWPRHHVRTVLLMVFRSLQSIGTPGRLTGSGRRRAASVTRRCSSAVCSTYRAFNCPPPLLRLLLVCALVSVQSAPSSNATSTWRDTSTTLPSHG